MAVLMDATMKVFPQKRQELLRVLEAMGNRIFRVNPDCLEYRFCQDREDENLIRLTLAWQSREKLDRFLASGQHGILLGAIQVLCEAPTITFRRIAGRT